jgi:hypothetical protein
LQADAVEAYREQVLAAQAAEKAREAADIAWFKVSGGWGVMMVGDGGG